MIQFIKVTNCFDETVTIEMKNPEKSGFFIKDIDGLGPTKSNINMTEVLSVDGAFFNSVHAQARNIVLNLGFLESQQYSIEHLRQESYRYFPIKQPLEIEIHTDERIGYAVGYVESNEPDIFSNAESTVISIICPEAFFFERDLTLIPFYVVNPLLEFPFENPSLTEKLIELGNIYIYTQKSIIYYGDEDTGVTIKIYISGPVHDLSIHNINRNQTMDISSIKLIALTGSDFIDGDILTISTIKGNKYVSLQRGATIYNLLNTLDINADWFILKRGDNVFVYEAESGISYILFELEYRIVYQGL